MDRSERSDGVFILAKASQMRRRRISNFRSSTRGLCSNITDVLQEFASCKVDDSAHRTVNLHPFYSLRANLREKGDEILWFFYPREREPRFRAIYKITHNHVCGKEREFVYLPSFFFSTMRFLFLKPTNYVKHKIESIMYCGKMYRYLLISDRVGCY